MTALQNCLISADLEEKYMKTIQSALAKCRAAGLLVATALVATQLGTASAASPNLTDIATIPLVNATSKSVLPNIWFILDDSGSMAWRTIPGAKGEYQFIPRLTDFWASSHCNGLGYNPGVTYSKPPSLGSTTYNDATFTSAWGDGFAQSGAVNLTNSIYFTYSGTQPDLNFAYNLSGGTETAVADTFYNECNTAPATITIGGGDNLCYVSSLRVGTTELLSGSTVTSTNTNTVASRVAGNVTASGYAARSSGSTVYIYSASANDAGQSPQATIVCTGSTWNNMTSSSIAFPSAASGPGLGKFTPVKLTASATAAEKTNYANWYSYYRTRINMAKSAIGSAFQDIRGTPRSFAVDPTDGDYFHARVGFTSINNNYNLNGVRSGDLAIAEFGVSTDTPSSTQKKSFYDRLYLANADNATPLRRKLAAAGAMYASATGPIQYYCQRNNTLLTTDGYWNESYSGVGNQDGGDTARPQHEGNTASSDSLADVAMYYYKTDLRTGGIWDKTLPDPDSSANTKIDDVATWQHMTTFTVGMGVDGQMKYDPAYKTDTTGDFYKIVNGTADWPAPIGDTPTAVDDLWHAAVNGRGTYFSAKNPRALSANLKQALLEMNVTTGGGSAEAGSALNPTPGTDYGYTPSYKTSDWTGDLVANQVLDTGDYSTAVAWSAATALTSKIAVDGKSDTRTIYTGKTSLVEFRSANVSSTDFDVSKLNQYKEEWTSVQKAAATTETLVNYLRGQNEYEVRSGATQPLYRYRKSVLGDIIHSQPVYVGEHLFPFDKSSDPLDSGYATFKQTPRDPTLYVGANDGMMHAFSARTGEELWAYVPPILHSNLWRLADRDYRVNHRYFVDGPSAVMDAKIGGQWRTVMVSGLGAGGRGYFAMDVTDPSKPSLLWSFTAEDDNNVGYTFGLPVIVKLDGQWVAVLASGYNNVPEDNGAKYPKADGGGYVFVRRLADGAKVTTISTGVGDLTPTTGPSGLATLTVENKGQADYTARGAYGGDLYGNMWRFDLAKGTATKLMVTGSSQPITSRPFVVRQKFAPNPMVFFGTGRYLGRSDIENTDRQAFYAVKDDGATTVTTSDLAHHVISSSGTLTSVAAAKPFGWYVDLPNSGERVNIPPQSQLGVVLFVTTVPPPVNPSDPSQDAACLPSGGSGWLYQLATGGDSVDGDSQVGLKLDSIPVGLLLTGTKNLSGYTDPKTADGRFSVNQGSAKKVTGDIKKRKMTGSDGKATRVQWRELLK